MKHQIELNGEVNRLKHELSKKNEFSEDRSISKELLTTDRFLYNAKTYTAKYLESSIVDVFIVWFSKTLQNKKAILSSKTSNGIIEVTYNGDKHQTYINVYKKSKNYRCKKHGGFN